MNTVVSLITTAAPMASLSAGERGLASPETDATGATGATDVMDVAGVTDVTDVADVAEAEGRDGGKRVLASRGCASAGQEDAPMSGDCLVVRVPGQGVFEGPWDAGKPEQGQWCVTYATGDKYNGAARPDPSCTVQPHGRGTLKLADGALFVGSFWEGLRHGHGTLYNTKETLVGQWEHGKLVSGETIDGEGKGKARSIPKHGGGTVYLANGSTYTGNFVNGKRHGTGKYVDGRTGFTYEGAWVEDLRQGHGEMRDDSGRCTYVGMWRDDKRWGHGKLIDYQTGETYEGDFKGGKFDGTGKWNQGNVSYKGDFLDGKRHGTGCCTYADGTVHMGEWYQGVRHGPGKVVSPDSVQFDGVWVMGHREGLGSLRLEDGTILEGIWKSDKPCDGDWTICYNNGDKYDGICKDGKPHGVGTMKYCSGDLFIGNFVNGMRHGKGKMFHATGEIEDTEFVDDVSKEFLSLVSNDDGALL